MTAPDRPGDHDQQQAAVWSALETVGAFDHSNDANRDQTYVAAIVRDALAAARAEEAARWQAKIEALADALAETARRHRYAATGSYDNGMARGYSVAAQEIRAVLDGER